MQTLPTGASLQGGKYVIKKILGQGGFGITYLAEHNLMGTDVAIKEFFMKELCNRDESTSHVTIGTEGGREQVDRFKEKFLKEARNIAQLHHPNIVRISDVFEENNTAYYVMDYCARGSVADLLKTHPTGLDEVTALTYIHQIALALQHIHERNMNHLDVKPANIMLNAEGHAVLIDFGLSKQYDDSGNQTSTTPVGISHGYAPIEQYKQGGVSEFSPATDIYALGATLYKLITGQTPPDAQALIEANLPVINASPMIANAIRMAMQVKRADRPQTVAAWLQMLGLSSYSSSDTVSDSTKTISAVKTEETRFIQSDINANAGKPNPGQTDSNRKADHPIYREQQKATKKSGKNKSLIIFGSIGCLFVVICIVFFIISIFVVSYDASYVDYPVYEEAEEVIDSIAVAEEEYYSAEADSVYYGY